MKKNKILGNKTKTLIILFFYYLFVSCVCFYFKLHFVFSTFLFMLIPSMFLIFLKPKIAKEMFIFSFTLGIPVGLYTQIIAERNFVWKYKPFLDFFHYKDIPLEALFWYPAWFGLVICTYLYFFDKHSHRFKFSEILPRHFKYLFFCLAILFISILLLNLNAYYSVFPYAYLSLISPIVFISFLIFYFNGHKKFFRIFLPTTLILFLPMLVYDLIGVYSEQWTFPGQYLYQIDFGIAKLPIEEFLIWLWIWPASLIAYFEEFESDFK